MYYDLRDEVTAGVVCSPKIGWILAGQNNNVNKVISFYYLITHENKKMAINDLFSLLGKHLQSVTRSRSIALRYPSITVFTSLSNHCIFILLP